PAFQGAPLLGVLLVDRVAAGLEIPRHHLRQLFAGVALGVDDRAQLAQRGSEGLLILRTRRQTMGRRHENGCNEKEPNRSFPRSAWERTVRAALRRAWISVATQSVAARRSHAERGNA